MKALIWVHERCTWVYVFHRVVHFLVGGRMSIVELKIAMIGFRHRYFRPMHSGAADPKGRGNCTQRVGSIE